MKTRRLIALGLLLPGFMGGCGGKVQSRDWKPELKDATPAGQPVQPAKDTPPVRPGDRMDANAGSADILAQKAEKYSQELTALAQARKNSPQLQSVPSQVNWIDNPFPAPSELRLGGEPAAHPAAAVQEPVKQVIDSTPATANPENTGVPPIIPLAKPNEAKAQEPVPSLRVQPIQLADATPKPAQPAAAPLAQDALSLRAQTRVKESPRDVWFQTENQLLHLIRDEPTPEMTSLANLPQEDRELVTAVVDGLTNFRNAMRQDSNMLLSAKIRPLIEMAERLKTQAELTIPTMALCTKVDRFGTYEPIDPPRFPAERENPLIVYCEVANFMSSLGAAQMWQVQLQWDMTLYTEQAIPVWSEKTQVVEDGSRTRRHDFFVRKVVTLPKTLPIGRYLLKVTIVDKQSNHVAEATAPLVIAAQ